MLWTRETESDNIIMIIFSRFCLSSQFNPLLNFHYSRAFSRSIPRRQTIVKFHHLKIVCRYFVFPIFSPLSSVLIKLWYNIVEHNHNLRRGRIFISIQLWCLPFSRCRFWLRDRWNFQIIHSLSDPRTECLRYHAAQPVFRKRQKIP